MSFFRRKAAGGHPGGGSARSGRAKGNRRLSPTTRLVLERLYGGQYSQVVTQRDGTPLEEMGYFEALMLDKAIEVLTAEECFGKCMRDDFKRRLDALSSRSLKFWNELLDGFDSYCVMQSEFLEKLVPACSQSGMTREELLESLLGLKRADTLMGPYLLASSEDEIYDIASKRMSEPLNLGLADLGVYGLAQPK